MTEQPHSTNAHYINRELSWVDFNRRVLDEGLREDLPPLERLKFLSIVSSNFREFFMVRVGGLKRSIRMKTASTCPTGLSLNQQMDEISCKVRDILEAQSNCLLNSVLPQLSAKGLHLVRQDSYTNEHYQYLNRIFDELVFPVLTPLRVSSSHPKLALSGASRLFVAFLLQNPDCPEDEKELGIVQLPPVLNRFITLPSRDQTSVYTLLEDVVKLNAEQLYPGSLILDSAAFCLTRDADMGVDENRDEDFQEAMADILVARAHSAPVRLDVEIPNHDLTGRLQKYFNLDSRDVYLLRIPLDFTAFFAFGSESQWDSLRRLPWKGSAHPEIDCTLPMWDQIKKKDILLHQPYQSFDPVVQLLSQAADDSRVLAIKMILYRTSGNSPIVRSLMKAASQGKHVTVLVEIKARFDESQNLHWANELEKAGAIVIRGVANLKVHAKLLVIVRKEAQGVVRYCHLGTGNYNDKTATMYVDMGFFTTNPEIGHDVSLFFNALAGYSAVPHMEKLAMAPTGLKKKIIEMIEREIQKNSPERPGLIMAKLNSLADIDVIDALYRASKAGVKVMLNVRGICMLKPHVKPFSENILVRSIIDRYLEHTRAVYFQNGGMEEVYLSSADWMVRNLEKRVELLFPVDDKNLIRQIKTILDTYFKDNTQSHDLQADGTWLRLSPGKKKAVAAQETFQKECQRDMPLNSLTRDGTLKIRRTSVKTS